LGFGLVSDDLTRRGWRGRLAASLISGVLAVGMTALAFGWYRETRHYIDDRGLPVRRGRPPRSELLLLGGPPPRGEPASNVVRLEHYTVPPDVTHVFGGYWDVYRLSFLSGKRIAGIPFPTYPNRFPGWSAGLGPGHGKMMVLRPSGESTS